MLRRNGRLLFVLQTGKVWQRRDVRRSAAEVDESLGILVHQGQGRRDLIEQFLGRAVLHGLVRPEGFDLRTRRLVELSRLQERVQLRFDLGGIRQRPAGLLLQVFLAQHGARSDRDRKCDQREPYERVGQRGVSS